MRAALFLVAGFLLSGCAHYEYEIVQPPGLAGHIGQNGETVVPIDPLVYRFQAVQGRLVMRVENLTSDPISAVGDKSAIVDPGGVSHAMGNQTIPPGAEFRLVLPPVREYAFGYVGPEVSCQAGMGSAATGTYEDDKSYYDGQAYVVDGGGDGADTFRWDGESDLRLTFTFDRGGKQFTQSFVFHREKKG